MTRGERTVPTAKRPGLVVSALLLSGLIGCSVGSGLNKKCNLPRKADGGVVFLTEGEVQEKTASAKDFIGFGSLDCEDLVCVRDSTFPKGTDLAAPALGYCSKQCVEGSTCASDDSALDKKADTALKCRPLLLDRETLAAIAADPALSNQLGNVREPYFCARGGAPDAG